MLYCYIDWKGPAFFLHSGAFLGPAYALRYALG